MSERFVILDTDVFGVAADLESPLWLSLTRLCAEASVQLCITDVVLQESLNLRKEQYQEVATQLLSANKRIAKFYTSPLGIYVPDAAEVAALWEGELRARFAVLASEPEDAREALMREASRRRPAREGRGGRDALNWLSALRLAAGGHEVFFVSRNTKDFAGRESQSLHPELLEEAARAPGNISYLSGLDDFFEILATKSPGPETTDLSTLERLIAVDLQSAAFDLHQVNPPSDDEGAAMPSTEVLIAELRTLRAYEVEDRGLALLAGQARVPVKPDYEELLSVSFLCWVEFDLRTMQLTAAELQRVTVPKAAS